MTGMENEECRKGLGLGIYIIIGIGVGLVVISAIIGILLVIRKYKNNKDETLPLVDNGNTFGSYIVVQVVVY